MNIELAIGVSADLTVVEGHSLAALVEHHLREEFSATGKVTVHVDPDTAPGLIHHHEVAHAYASGIGQQH